MYDCGVNAVMATSMLAYLYMFKSASALFMRCVKLSHSVCKLCRCVSVVCLEVWGESVYENW